MHLVENTTFTISERFVDQMCVCNQGANADNLADAVDRLLIEHYILYSRMQSASFETILA